MSQRYLGGIITANPTTPTMTSESGVWTLEQQFQYSNVWSPKIVGNSVRLRSSASAYFNRTLTTPTNNKIWTWSSWVKRGSLGSAQVLLSSDVGTSNTTWLEFGFDAADTFTVTSYTTDVNTTSAVFRDPSAWYHIVVAFDTTQATAANRCKIYVNGTQQTLTGAGFTLNAGYGINSAQAHSIGQRNWASGVGRYYDGYLAEINFIDGQALTPSSFGAYDSTGVWQPLPYTGTYGTNGFYLTFADNSAATSTTLGKDYSGNGNNWTPNNFSLTAGTTYDWMLDSPTNWTSGTGNGVANYPVLNPLYKGYGGYTATPLTFSNANLSVTGNGSANNGAATMALPSTGKFYWEYVWTATAGGEMDGGIIGIAGLPYFYRYDGTYYNGSTYVAYGASYTTNDVIGVAIDMDNLTFTFYKNNVSQGVKTAAFPSGGTYFPWVYCSNTVGASINFGQRPFSYTPPSGYVALNTLNLPDSNITNGAQYMAATTYTGNASTQTITNGGNNTIGTTFKPDFVWTKSRANAYSPNLYDSVRGVNNYLQSNQTAGETTLAGTLTSFNSNGFTLGNQDNSNYTNGSTAVAWQWQAGQGTTSSNTSGSITSTVSVNTKAGFSVVTYTGNGTNGATIGHGLGVAPSMIIVKDRTSVTSWGVYFSALGNTGGLYLSGTNAFTVTSLFWNNTSPTSTVFSVSTNIINNQSGDNYVAYCWAAVAGYSAFGSYTGNGSSDGPFVYCGFRPRFVLVKRTDAAYGWTMEDSSRNPSNVVTYMLQANASDAEASSAYEYDFLSNGFKARNSTVSNNASGGTYIYAAFAENPFKIARAR